MRKSLLLICIILCIVSSTIAQNRVVCYWDSTSTRHVDLKGFFNVTDIDPTICTHIIYTYIRFLQSVIIVPTNIDDTITAFVNLKQINPNVKLLVSVGGSAQPSQIFSTIANTETDRVLSATKVKEFLNKFGLDGVDIDWQYPNQGSGSNAVDKTNFVKLLLTWRQQLTNSTIISISVGPKQQDITLSYDIAGITQYVDFINLNSYNLRGTAEDTVTAFHSPYRKEIGEIDEKAEWNAESIVNNWIASGCPPSKLTLGIATYGRSYTLSDVSKTGVGAPVNGIGKLSSYFRDLGINGGILPYAEICYNVKNNGWKETLDEGHFAFYTVFDGDQWVSYDNRKAVIAKVHLVLDKKLGGVNYASIDRDDFYNECGEGKFPLIKIGYDAIVHGNIEENPLKALTTLAPTTPKPTQVTIPVQTTASTNKPGGVTTTTEPSTTTTSTTTQTTTSQQTTTQTTTLKPSTATSISSTQSTSKTSPPSTTTRSTTTKTTTTTQKLPDEFTPPIFTGPATTQTITKTPDEDTRPTTSSGTTSTKSTTEKRSSASTLTAFPTPPTLNGLREVSTTTEIPTTQTTTLAPSTTQQTTTTTKKKTTTTTTHFPTPPVLL